MIQGLIEEDALDLLSVQLTNRMDSDLKKMAKVFAILMFTVLINLIY